MEVEMQAVPEEEEIDVKPIILSNGEGRAFAQYFL